MRIEKREEKNWRSDSTSNWALRWDWCWLKSLDYYRQFIQFQQFFFAFEIHVSVELAYIEAIKTHNIQ